MRCTEAAGRPLPDGKFFGRDIGDRGRYAILIRKHTIPKYCLEESHDTVPRRR